MSLTGRILHRRLQRAVRWNEQRVGAAKGIKAAMRYVFPDHWSFLLGEIALYSFMVLIGTGIFLALYYSPGDSQVIYHGPYSLLGGEQMSEAYRSVLDLSFSVPAGLLFRQVHHWAADVFIAAIVIHLARIFFTGAYRKPRDLNYYIGLVMLMLSILEGFAGYSLADDLLSGMGLAIAYSVAFAIPGIGAQLGYLVWGGPFPGSSSFLPRLEIVHVFLIPLALLGLITVHLAMIMRQHHSQFPGPGRRERNVVGTPLWPAYALRSVGLLLAVAAVLFLLGGLVQINPIWQWGPVSPVSLGERRAARLVHRLADRRAALDAEFRALLRWRTPRCRTRSGAAWRSRSSCSGCCSPGRGSSGGSPATSAATTCSTARATIRPAPPSALPSCPGW